MKLIIHFAFTIFLFSSQLFAQSVTISPSGTSALIDAKSTTGGTTLPNMNMSQRGALTPKPGLQVFCNNCSPVGPYVYDGTQWKAMFNIANGNTTIYSVGQQAQGGTVIWVDDSGQHGLVAAPEDVPVVNFGFPYGNKGIKWGNMLYKAEDVNQNEPLHVGAMGPGVYDGEKNTDVIVNKLGWDSYAAFLCRQMNFNRYGGWYLPSLAELLLIYENKNILTGLSKTVKLDAYYWSSNEGSQTEAVMVNLVDGEVSNYNKSSTYHTAGDFPYYAHRARAVRRF
ncbi:DUF1566 domain-containing protein [Emticicia sp. C21]|uniref:DUF1566 domain-containing protein n=1 Tax=Emticicia sp. C21 TaxID=2302915 RepID=UPI000E3411D6|nr:DUF1566 domain-containing protein [Emticicia sp. C21]RFS17791.1 DUF1566 domain-containing protein [Emticicia sp. C21]